MQKSEFRLWDDCVIFRNGMYYYLDGESGASLISMDCAKKIEADYYYYQAGMDVGRGGEEPERVYLGRGFSKDANGNWKYTRSYEVEALAGNETVSPIEGDFSIPANLSGRQEINQIRREAFLGCNYLSKVIVPKTVQLIGTKAFAGCEQLETISFSDTVQVIEEKAFADTAFYKTEENWIEGALYLNGWLIKVRGQVQGIFDVPDGTIGIANGAFHNCDKLTGINMPDSVKYIGSFAFEGCEELLNIKFPKKVSCFGDRVLSKCPNLTHIKIPSGVKNLNAMLRDCKNLVSVKIPEGITQIGPYAFANCEKLTDIELPDGVTCIASTAFENTGYMNDESNWEEGVLYLGKWLLKADVSVCGDYMVKEGTVGIADYAFGGFMKCVCPNLTGVNIADSVKYIGESAFENCSKLTEVSIPDQVECIRCSVFRECSSLTKVRFGPNVKVMGKWVFYRNMNLESLIIENPSLEMADAAICNCPKLTIHAPEGSTAQKYAFWGNIAFLSED